VRADRPGIKKRQKSAINTHHCKCEDDNDSTWENVTMATAKDYFEGALRELIKSKAGLRGTVNGYVMFTVVGEDQGAWVYDLRKDGSGDLVADHDETPVLQLVVRDTFLPDFVSGKADLQKGLEDGSWAIRGVPDAANAFGEMLTGGSSPLSLQIGNKG